MIKNRVVMLLSNAYNPDDRVRNEALALTKEGYEIIIIAWDRFLDKPIEEVINGITVKRVRLKSGYGQKIEKYLSYIRIWVLFLIQVIKLKPEILHCHDFDTYFVGLCYRLFNKKVKLIYDAHENYYMMMKPLVSRTISQFIGYSEIKFTKYAGLVIGSCVATANHYKERGAKNLIVVGNWKEPQLFSFSSEQIYRKRSEIGAQDHLIVIYIGALTDDRNVIPLIEAIQKRPWAFVIIGGTGGQEAEIKDLCATLPNAYFPGYVHPDDVPLLTSISDVVYYGLDSTDTYAPYNAPNKLFEALAAGKSIIASDLGGELSYIVKTEDCGILLSSINADSIGEALDCISNKALREKLAINSKNAGKHLYNWQTASRKLCDAYFNLAQA